jgi:hypothetical protein
MITGKKFTRHVGEERPDSERLRFTRRDQWKGQALFLNRLTRTRDALITLFMGALPPSLRGLSGMMPNLGDTWARLPVFSGF